VAVRNKNLLIIIAVVAAITAVQTHRRAGDSERVEAARQEQTVERPRSDAGGDALENAYQTRASNVQVAGHGVVDRSLKDDDDGSRHQRFILRLASGRTLLVAHNIDLAPRIENLREGDTVRFFGEYEWNDKGGVLHWTHHDPQGRHVAGWLEHAGRKYQ
jgi:hypothetical protein